MKTFIFGTLLAVSSVFAEAQTPSQLQKQITALQAQITSLKTQVAMLSPLAAIAPYVHFDSQVENGVTGPHITFSGVNVHIVNGGGTTWGANGLGNLIIGYDEVPIYQMAVLGGPQLSGSTLQGLLPGDRGGSHNLIIGQHHRFLTAAYGGLVAGDANSLLGGSDSILGGFYNVAGSYGTVISGGCQNVAVGTFSLICGGFLNGASGSYTSVLGGVSNTAVGVQSVILGGYNIQSPVGGTVDSMAITVQ